MKKLLRCFGLISVLLAAGAICVSAQNGDVCGNIYSTDIRANINGVWVDSYNIGGRTVVVVEDITSQYKYSDADRLLVIDDLAPEFLVDGGNNASGASGTVVGEIYETDIKTYFRGRYLDLYSLNGKMAVEIEQLGGNGEFSDIGGRYVWNSEERTICLESVFRYSYDLHQKLGDKGYNMVISALDGSLTANFERAGAVGGNVLCGEEISENSMNAVWLDGEIVGYRCSFPEIVFADGKAVERTSLIECFYEDKIESKLSELEKVVPTAEEWDDYFKNMNGKIVDSFETDEYMFFYVRSSTTHGASEWLFKASKTDGSMVSFGDNFKSVSLYGTKQYDSVKIDRENEKVYVHYDYDYIIDLKTDKVERTEMQ